jgi:hypothetical protein
MLLDEIFFVLPSSMNLHIGCANWRGLCMRKYISGQLQENGQLQKYGQLLENGQRGRR